MHQPRNETPQTPRLHLVDWLPAAGGTLLLQSGPRKGNVHGSEQVIKTTNEHPFWVAGEKTYVEAKNLRQGDRFRGADGQFFELTASTYEPHPNGIPVYNVEFEGRNT